MIDYQNYKDVGIYEISSIERATKGKTYPAGSTLIPLSAIRIGIDAEYLKTDSEVDTRYAVIIPKDIHDAEFIFQMVQMQLSKFLEKYMTGINLQFGELKHLHIRMFNQETRQFIVKAMVTVDHSIECEKKEIEKLKDEKKFYLANMFPNDERMNNGQFKK